MIGSEIVTAVLFANGLTFAIIYALWRIKRNERDLIGVGLFLFFCLIAVLTAYSVGQPKEPQETLY